jgi:hypothetical protein
MPQGAELLCLVGPGHGHPASPPSVPLQVMQQIASGFKSAEVTSATLSAADAALLPGIAISGAASFTIASLVGNW